MARILVVDDDADIREFLELALRRNGHDVKTATGDLEAYAMGVEFRPEVLVIDWMLEASVDGIEVAQVLRARLPRLQVILISGNSSEALVGEAAAAEIPTVLAKPFSFRTLTEVIQEAAAGS